MATNPSKPSGHVHPDDQNATPDPVTDLAEATSLIMRAATTLASAHQNGAVLLKLRILASELSEEALAVAKMAGSGQEKSGQD